MCVDAVAERTFQGEKEALQCEAANDEDDASSIRKSQPGLQRKGLIPFPCTHLSRSQQAHAWRAKSVPPRAHRSDCALLRLACCQVAQLLQQQYQGHLDRTSNLCAIIKELIGA